MAASLFSLKELNWSLLSAKSFYMEMFSNPAKLEDLLHENSSDIFLDALRENILSVSIMQKDFLALLAKCGNGKEEVGA